MRIPIVHALSSILPATTQTVPSLLDNHLRNSMPTQCLAPYKTLSLNPSQQIEECRKQQEHRRSHQARRAEDEAEPLDHAQNAVERRAHVVCLKAADEGVELGGRRADAQEERDLDEDDDEGGDSGVVLVMSATMQQRAEKERRAYRQITLNIQMRRGREMRFAMPTAKQRRTHMTPVLQKHVSTRFAAHHMTLFRFRKVRCSFDQYRAADGSRSDTARLRWAVR